MNRSTRTMVVVGIALALAGLASFSVYRAIKNLPEKQVPIAERFTVVAAQNIPVGVMLTKEQVTVIPWPANSPVAGGFTSPDEVIGRGVTSMLVQNEPIVETKLAPRQAGGGLPPLITPGMRAMTVRVNDVIGVAGFTQAGHRVDVVVILSGNEAAARTVLSNIQVLSADRRIDQEQARAGTGADQRVVTLLVSPEDGEKLALATTQGQIVLALRNPLDVVLTETKGVRVSSLMSGAGAAAPAAPRASRPRATAPPPPPPAPAGPKVVQAIRGPKVTQEVIKCCQ